MLALPLRGSTPELYHGKYVAGMFANGENGVWYDPSDLSTLFQDAAGTKPVTAVEQPVGLILDKSKGLVLGPELVPSGTFSGDLTGWVPNRGGTIAIVSGELEVAGAGVDYFGGATPAFTTVVGRRYVATGVCRRGTTTGNAYLVTGAWNSKMVSATTNTPVQLVFEAVSTRTKLLCLVYGATTGTAYFDNISVRELPGNHAYQSTSASRPVLSARVNLLTKTEQFDDAAWSKTNGTVTANAVVAPDGTLTADKLVENTANAQHYVQQVVSLSAVSHAFSFYAKQGERGFVVAINTTGSNQFAIFDLTTGVVSSTGAGATSAIQNIGNGWYKCSIIFTAASGSNIFRIYPCTNGSITVYTGDGYSGIYIWGADLRATNAGVGIPAYQRVNTSTDYDTVGFPYYLSFDGVDDYLSTGSINFTGTDKMTVFAGVRKLSDAAAGIVVELSANRYDNAGAISLLAPGGGGNKQYLFASRGTVDGAFATVSPNTYPTTQTAVLTGIGNISGDQSLLRVNGSTAATAGAIDQGTGNYGNYPLYIGRRGGTLIPFNGGIYGLIVRGAQTDDAHLTHAEKYLAYKSGVTL